MKKTTFLFIALFMLAFSAAPQDTIFLGDIYNGNYFYYGPYEDFRSGDFYPIYNYGPEGGGETAKRLYSADTLTVYGIAAGLKRSTTPNSYLYDTTLTNTYEYLRIYYPTADSMQWLRQALVHWGTTPVSYYGTFNLGGNNPGMHIIPVYERYFSEPVEVVDTFYTGMTYFCRIPYVDSNGHTWQYPRPYMGLCRLGSYQIGWREYYRGYFLHSDGNIWFDNYLANCYFFIFPILTPAPDDYEWDTVASGVDTTAVTGDTIMAGDTLIVCDTIFISDTVIVGYDTIINYDTIITYDTILALPEAGLLGRLVGVMPNPAGTTAKVVSSFGLTMVEAFNMAGERLCTLRLPDAPLAATLDVSRWPSGSYLLRIHTPQGVITRKLMVRR